jgi:hypothetical protein
MMKISTKPFPMGPNYIPPLRLNGGTGMINWLFDTSQRRDARVQVRRTYTPAGRQPIRVQRELRAYWTERGWIRKGADYTGQFQTRYGSWQGCIRESPSGRVETFIYNPPAQLRRHCHWPCFRDRGNFWYFVHPVLEVPDVSAAIIAIEQTLNEAFTL